ncbi:unnamed protein product [Cochlearia groenlandica]
MGNCIHTLVCNHGNKVKDVLLNDASTEEAKESPLVEAAEQKTGKRRCIIKITLTRKQLEELLKNVEKVSFQLPETRGSGKQKWKPSLETVVESLSFNISPVSVSISRVRSKRKMEIKFKVRLMEYKLHFMATIAMSLVLAFLVYAAPRILDILTYFWPLFASTAAFTAIALTFGGFQQLSDEDTGDKIMDYVAGRHEDSHNYI